VACPCESETCWKLSSKAPGGEDKNQPPGGPEIRDQRSEAGAACALNAAPAGQESQKAEVGGQKGVDQVRDCRYGDQGGVEKVRISGKREAIQYLESSIRRRISKICVIRG
jgi:hypothetical protein